MSNPLTDSLSDKDYVSFADSSDIIGLHEDDSHLMVYGSINDGESSEARLGLRTQSLFVMSALIDEKDFDKYLEEGTYYNYPFGELGNPGLWTDESDEVHFTLGQQREGNGIQANYFVRNYFPHGRGSQRFPIAQSFVFFHELTEHIRKYKRLYIDELEDAVVIREESNPSDRKQNRVIVSKHYLREYLAARKMGLAIWTSVQRYSKIDDDFKNPKDKNEGIKHIHVREADWMGKPTDKIYFGELVFKTLIRPYDDLSWSKHNWDFRKEDDERVQMIIKIDKKSGNSIFSDKTTDFLTPVYFRKDVLGKYIEDERSTVGTSSKELGQIRHLDQWSVTYGLNSMDRIVVWIGDLEKLPIEEQYYWRHFNIKPEGGIAREFFKTQIEAQWVNTTSLEKQLVDLRSEINKNFKNNYGTILFKPNEDDSENEKQLHTAIKKGPKALKPQIIAIAKLFIDAIDKKALITAIGDESLTVDKSSKDLGTIGLLQVFYNKLTGYELNVTDTLQLIWKLRSILSHTFNEESYAQEIDTYDGRLDPSDPSSLYPHVMTQLVRQLTYINEVVESSGTK